MTEKEACGLKEKHQREHDAHGCSGGGVELAHEKRVGDVVEIGHQHRDNRGQSHGDNDPMDGTARKISIIVALFFQ